MSDEVYVRKNVSAVRQAITELQERSYDQQAKIDALLAALGGMAERVADLERQLTVQKVISFGHGPSVR